MQKILFIELLGGIGDIVIALSAIHALALTYPEAELTVLTFRPGNELLKSDPLIQRVLCAESGNAKQSVIELLTRETFDLIVSDTNYEDIDKVIFKSSASQKVTNLWRQPPPNERVGDRFVKILQVEGLIGADAVKPTQLYLTYEEINKAQEQFLNIPRPLVFLCPDAGMSIKRWADINFITLGQILQQRWNATVVVPVGSNEQQALAIAKGIGGEAQVFPRGKLRDFAATLACGDLVIASDTGPARIAACIKYINYYFIWSFLARSLRSTVASCQFTRISRMSRTEYQQFYCTRMLVQWRVPFR